MPEMDEIVARVAETIRKYDLIEKGDRVLIGLSGGPDSVAMMHILYSLGEMLEFSLSAAYINHKLRPRAAKREARFCDTLCGRYSIPFKAGEIDIPQLSRKDKTGLEETARIYRYRILEKMAQEQDCDKIAVGHHRDDRAETVLFNLLRGSGRMGLAAIPPRRGKIIRPLYDLNRPEIADYIEDCGLKFMVDRSNQSLKFTRNRIRRRVIPMLKRVVTESAVENIVRFSEIMADEERFLGHMASEVLEKVISRTPGGKIRLDLSHKLKYDIWLKRRLVLGILADAGPADIEFAEVERIVELIDGERQTRLAIRDDWMAETAGDGLYLYRPGTQIGRYKVTVPGQCRMDYPHMKIDFEYAAAERVKDLETASSQTAYIDAERVVDELYITGLEPGARFRPFGRPGSKKVGDFLTDCKYPRPLRDELPVVYDGAGIVWLAGLEIDHRVRVRNETRKILKIEIGES